MKVTLPRKSAKRELPLVPLRELVVFPHMVVPFFVGRPGSIQAVEEAMNADRMIFLACQRSEIDDPAEDDIYVAGTVARILQMLKVQDGKVRILAEGLERGTIQRFQKKRDAYVIELKSIPDGGEVTPTISALVASVHDSFRRYSRLQKKLPPEAVNAIERTDSPDKLVDLICANVPLKIEKKVEMLGLEETAPRLEAMIITLESENELLAIQNKINTKVRKRLEKSQKDYFLNEQLKEINRELGRDDADTTGAIEIEKRLREKKLDSDILEKMLKECRRLSKLQPMSPEAGVVRTYLEWIIDLPWNEGSQDNKDIERAARILDEDHYNMKKAKERILDFIAVRQLKERLKGPIICFVGPPGTGKTSLGKSVARALDRQFVRVSLGGVRDEAEIRGHRKTYVGALPGKIIQSMKKVGTSNPVFLLDEIDKISSDFRGDPASALLEVLDPEQNNTFVDHYLEVPYDLSNVMFITTANSVYTIPHPLRDRMEIIEIPGYTDFEKLRIAQDFIVPKQLRENGLDWADIRFQQGSLLRIIRGYTMESGVRNLEREIATVIRKIAREAIKKGHAIAPPATDSLDDTVANSSPVVAEGTVDAAASSTGGDLPAGAARGSDADASIGNAAASPAQLGDGKAAPAVVSRRAKSARVSVPEPGENGNAAVPERATGPRPRRFTAIITPSRITKYLGTPRFLGDIVYSDARPGLAHGLAWTEIGGTLLPVEVAILDGQGDLILTGSLGDVMKESARTALSFLKVHYRRLNIPADFATGKDIHIHVPEGAIPKDGPSAGITLAAAMLSAFAGIPIRKGFAMTGEITLTGRLLSIGGVKEKVLAAYRNKMHSVLMPEANRKDIEELPKEVRSAMKFVFCDSALDALLTLIQ